MGFSYGYETSAVVAELLGSGLLFFTNFFGIGLSIVMYILQSLGLYTVACRRQLKNPWLAWLPIGNMWILGSISDQYQYVAKGRVRSRRKVLLGFHIAIIALAVIWVIASFGAFIGGILSMRETHIVSEAQALELVIAPLLTFLGMALILWIVAVIGAVIQYIALYDYYRSCEPKNAALYLVFSILISSFLGIFIFLCREKDGGMPPRRTGSPFAEDQPAQGPEF